MEQPIPFAEAAAGLGVLLFLIALMLFLCWQRLAAIVRALAVLADRPAAEPRPEPAIPPPAPAPPIPAPLVPAETHQRIALLKERTACLADLAELRDKLGEEGDLVARDWVRLGAALQLGRLVADRRYAPDLAAATAALERIQAHRGSADPFGGLHETVAAALETAAADLIAAIDALTRSARWALPAFDEQV